MDMPTRLELRTAIRRRLADTAVDPLWDDALLNDAIAEGIRRYSTRVPRQMSTMLAVTVGDRELTIPPTVNAMRVVRLFDDRGEMWQRWHGGAPFPPVPELRTGGELVWRAWADAIYLDTPAPRSGFWRCEHLENRVVPTNDTAQLDIQPGDDDLIIALAVAVALDRRAIADGKRYTGKAGVHPLAAAARTARIDADRLVWERLRAVKSL
jgi:hypothetical protein